MIPKIIHYCWFGGGTKPKLMQKCIRSWSKYCPDYRIIEWNESNYDISSAPMYVRQAMEAKKWAFATDYIRYQVVYENGGIYLDTDVEVIRNLDEFLNDTAFFSYAKDNGLISSGLGFGAEKGSAILRDLMDSYENRCFVLPNGEFNAKSCPTLDKPVFLSHGVSYDGLEQMLEGNIHIYPDEYFSPIGLSTGKMIKTDKTASIHWHSMSWMSRRERLKRRLYYTFFDQIQFFKNKLGSRLYRKISDLLWGKKEKPD